MIRRPEDYRYVDFSAGDMPTALFNGEIFPLRNEPRALKGEDIAFAYEAAAARLKALDGAESGAGFVYHAPAVEVLTPTRVLSANQMNAVTAKINAVTAMKPAVDYSHYDSTIGALAVGFLKDDLEEVEARDGNLLTIYNECILPHCFSDSMGEVHSGDPLRSLYLDECYRRLKQTSRAIVVNSLSDSEFGEAVQINGTDDYKWIRPVYLRQQHTFVTYGTTRSPGDVEYAVLASSHTPIGKLPKSSVKSIIKVFASFVGEDYFSGSEKWRFAASIMDITDAVTIVERGGFFEITISAEARLPYFLRFVAECGGVWPAPIETSGISGFEASVAFRPYFICELDDRTTW